MEANSPRWKQITPSEYPWEQEALSFVRERLPDHEPYRAWACCEVAADDGSINEVDLLVLSPKGFFLVEIKSWPGVVTGDAGTWTVEHEGRTRVHDSPLVGANRKARKLISLLRRQPALRAAKSPPPFLAACVFLAHPDAECRLPAGARENVHLRERYDDEGREIAPGIVAALERWDAHRPPQKLVDRPMAKAITQAIEQAAIRPSQRLRRVLDYQLGDLLREGPGYQDFEARHVALERERVRVRIYGVPEAATEETRAGLRRAARREYEILAGIQHEGILRTKSYTEHERGPALVFEHRARSQGLDHDLAERGDSLDLEQRLHLLRQIAESVHYAHTKHLAHRALSPQSILVLDPDARLPHTQVYSWHTAMRDAIDSQGRGTTETWHVESLVESAALVYLAPEAARDHAATGAQLDVFSLGAIAYRIFSGSAPATGTIELRARLDHDRGLLLSSAVDGADELLQSLIQHATHPEVSERLESAREILTALDEIEDALTRPEPTVHPDPLEAPK